MFKWLKRCKHRWEESSRTWNPPIAQVQQMPLRFHDMPEDEQKCVFGFTNIEIRCKECGRLQVVTIVGKTGIEEGKS